MVLHRKKPIKNIILILLMVIIIFYSGHNNTDTTTASRSVQAKEPIQINTASLTPESFYPIANKCKNASDTYSAFCNNCFNSSYDLLIQNDAICKTFTEKDHIIIFIFILSTPAESSRRDAIRQTWLSHNEIRNNTGSVRYAFLLGSTSNGTVSKKIDQENDIYHDIIQESFHDSYRNLTLKTIMGFKWASTFCAHAGFVMKIDDDMWLNVPFLLNFVNRQNNTLQTTLGGFCVEGMKPYRDQTSKWYVSCKEYPFRVFPKYCSGTGYVTSMNVAKQLYDISRNVPFLMFEDVYIGICLNHLKMNTKTFKGFWARGAKFGTCEFKSEKVITVHGISPSKMFEIWNSRCT